MNSPISMRQQVFHSFLKYLKADESEIEYISLLIYI